MNSNAYNYFLDLNKEDLIHENGALAFYKNKFKNISRNGIVTYKDTPFFTKQWRDKYSINSYVSSNMYNELGILTPPIYKLRKRSYPNCEERYSEISQDVHSIKDFICTSANEIEKLDEISELCSLDGFKWSALYDYDLKRRYLQIMTKECFDELMAIFILAELRTDNDLHDKNFFLAKSKDSPKYEKVIPIDLELSTILCYCKGTKYDFKNFLVKNYATYGPDLWIDNDMSYKFRLELIQDLVQDGVLSDRVIEILRNALIYDYPGEIKKAFVDFHEKDVKHATYNNISYLWDYNREHLGKDLDL